MNDAKILDGALGLRETGMGDVSNVLITKRAEEIALIDGRKPEDYTDADYNQAEMELRREIPVDPDNPPEPVNGVRLVEEAVATTGHRLPKGSYEDEETIGTKLVREGIEEAVHNEMVESGKATLAEEEP